MTDFELKENKDKYRIKFSDPSFCTLHFTILIDVVIHIRNMEIFVKNLAMETLVWVLFLTGIQYTISGNR